MKTLEEQEPKEKARAYARAYYHKHKEKYLQTQKAYRLRNKEKIKKKDEAWLKKNPEYHKLYYLKNKQKWHERQAKRREKYRLNIEGFRDKTLVRQKKNNERIKIEVLKHYGGEPPKCACCGESNLPFLVIDHVYGGGNKQRKIIRGGTRGLYFWLIRNNFPDGFQVLCRNCNGAKGDSGKMFCPVHHAEQYAT
jgi:hypothetical protein